MRQTRELLAKVGLKEPPTALITDLGVGKQQLVEIAKALSKKVKLLILDEPTASLNESDSDALLDLLLGTQGARHLLDPDLAQAQRDRQGGRLDHRAARRRHGRDAWTAAPRRSARTASSAAWWGATWRDRYPAARRRGSARPCSRCATGACTTRCTPSASMIKGVDLHVRRGEIVGIAGLMGAGRTELAMSVFGRSYGQRISGQVFMHGKAVDVSHHRQGHRPRHRLRHRGPQGRSAWCWRKTSASNMTLANLAAVSRRRRDRRRARVQGGERLPPRARHPLLRRRPAGRQPVGRQPAEGGARASGCSRSPSC